MEKIGFSDFRKFESFPILDLGKITLLVGGNNAGKSTFVKAALLIYNFVHTKVSDLQKSSIFGTMSPEMYFDVVSPYDVHIGTFFRAKRNGSSLDSPIIFNFDIKGFSFEVKVAGTIVNGKIDENAVSGKVISLIITDNLSNTTYIIDYTTHRMLVEFKKSDFKSGEQVELLRNQRNDLELALSKETNFAKIVQLKSQIAEISKQLHIKGDVQTEDTLLDLPLCDFSDSPSEYFLSNVIKAFQEYGQLPTPANIVKNSKEYKKDIADKNFLKSKDSVISNSARNLAFAISQTDFEYIYAHAARQIVFFNSKDKNDYMAQTIHEFTSSKANHDEKAIEFIKYWMSEKDGFNIGDKYSIIEHGGEAYEIFISKGASKTPLADMGMGSIQMMILLLRLATFIKRYGTRKFPPTIIIEEPEQNLHPALQGKLASLFKYLYDKYKFTFIVETHSEYLVRNTQVIVAKEGFTAESLESSNPFKVYYFPSRTDRKPYAMIYRPDGNFKNEFEPGFFDAANELLFAIL